MQFRTKKQVEAEWGPANAITPSQILNVFELANVGKNDIFYDLGSGHGRIIRMAITEKHPKLAIGIENDVNRFWRSVINAKRYLSKKQLKKIYFWCIDMEYADFSDATVVYDGLEEDIKDIDLYKKTFKNNQVKIVKRDLPLVSYKPIGVNNESSTCWFFLMRYPLYKYKIRNKNEWASHVLGRKNVTIKDVYDYYTRQLEKRQIIPRERKRILGELKKLVSERF